MSKKDIRIANFNLLNLNVAGAPIYGNEGWTDTEYAAKIAFSSRVLDSIDADVVGFQELWDGAALEDVFSADGLKGKYDLVYRASDTPGIQCAFAAKKGLIKGDATWIDAFPQDARFVDLKESRDAQESVSVTISKFSRPLLRIVLNKAAGTPDVVFYVTHLKSKGPTQLKKNPDNPVQKTNPFIAQSVVSHVRRMVEAGAFRAILDKEMKGNDKPVVVLGDLNDGTTSISTELLSGSPGYRFFAKSVAGTKSDAGLYTVEKLQQLRSFRHVYYTHIFKNQMESLDHIMVSDSFYDHSSQRQWSFREMRVFNDHLTASEGERSRLGYNDHAIIVADFDWNPMMQEIKDIMSPVA